MDRHLLVHVLESEEDVLVDRHVRPEGVVLEEEADVSLVGRDVDSLIGIEDDLVSDRDSSGSRGLKARDHTERRGLSASGRTQKGDESLIFDLHVEVVGSIEVVPSLRNIFE